jgi:hypothetical protein
MLAAQSLTSDEGWAGLVRQLAETTWTPLRLGYFTDDLVDAQRPGINAAQQCRTCWKRYSWLASDSGSPTEDDTTWRSSLAPRLPTEPPRLVMIGFSRRAYIAAGHPRAALADLGRSLLLDEERGDRQGIALRHSGIGQVHAHPEIADLVQAIWHLRTSAELMAALGDAMEHAGAVTYFAEVHLDAQQPDAALFALRRIEHVLTCCGSIRYRVHAYNRHGPRAPS